ncbi:hypothetical protein BDZ97DRAFT_1658971 [Flammula alnicola]|nr:hypothetical protein BDZ97DRAFT_1658971 [Flammula alnicola]
MGQFLEEIPQYLIEWILKQQMFWVASAPLSPDGHVNVSPKAIEGTFHVVHSRRVWYEDLSGSGAETVAHIRENGRVTILFHAFEGPARIVRLYGKGFFHEIGTPEYEALIGSEKRLPGSRAVIGLDVHKVGTTCGYAVPYYQFISHRTQLIDWAVKKESVDHHHDTTESASVELSSSSISIDERAPVNPNGMKNWWQSHNLSSLDGLPAFSVNLGRGFPFGISLKRTRNALARPAVHSKMLNPRHVVTTASSHGSAIVSQQTGHTFEPSSQLLQAYRYPYRYNYRDVVSLISRLLPFLLTFIFGVFLSRTYDHHIYRDQRLGMRFIPITS